MDEGYHVWKRATSLGPHCYRSVNGKLPRDYRNLYGVSTILLFMKPRHYLFLSISSGFLWKHSRKHSSSMSYFARIGVGTYRTAAKFVVLDTKSKSVFIFAYLLVFDHRDRLLDSLSSPLNGMQKIHCETEVLLSHPSARSVSQAGSNLSWTLPRFDIQLGRHSGSTFSVDIYFKRLLFTLPLTTSFCA